MEGGTSTTEHSDYEEEIAIVRAQHLHPNGPHLLSLDLTLNSTTASPACLSPHSPSDVADPGSGNDLFWGPDNTSSLPIPPTSNPPAVTVALPAGSVWGKRPDLKPPPVMALHRRPQPTPQPRPISAPADVATCPATTTQPHAPQPYIPPRPEGEKPPQAMVGDASDFASAFYDAKHAGEREHHLRREYASRDPARAFRIQKREMQRQEEAERQRVRQIERSVGGQVRGEGLGRAERKELRVAQAQRGRKDRQGGGAGGRM